VHSLVEFADGSYKAQLGLPDMRLPIQYAVTFPDRMPSLIPRSAPVDWGTLDFQSLADGAYPAFDAVRAAADAGGNRGAVLNAADEVAVGAFLAGRLAYPAIASTIASAVERWGDPGEPDLAAIVALDAEVRSTLAAELG
jgi:1-deoxy-D-xylulose-5-phosphate reductoisomerase